MNAAIAFSIIGLLVNRGVDFLRNAFDKHDRIPKAYWLLAAWGLGILVSWGICNSTVTVAFLKLPANSSCRAMVLTGLGFGSVAGFWHEVMSRLSAMPALTPKGLVPRASGEAPAPGVGQAPPA